MGDTSVSFKISFITPAVLTGKVLFSMAIVWLLECFATCLAQDSINFKSLACPAPNPLSLTGVFTHKKIISEFSIVFSISLEK